MDKITFFHRNPKSGYSINIVTQTILAHLPFKDEFYMPYYSASFSSLLKNLKYTYRHRNRIGINHITGDIHYCLLALIGCKSVITIHDTFLVDFKKSNILKKFIYILFWYKLPIFFASRVVCITNDTRKHLKKYTKRKDIEVIHNAINPSFKTKLKDIDKIPYNILFIGTTENKNLERTVKALKGFNCMLTIIGKLSEGQIEYLKEQQIKYRNKYNLSEIEMIREYENCDIVSFISLFEGFGMPFIEANKVGRPVITSTIPVLVEVAGNSAVFVDPMEVDNMKQGFERLFTDSYLRNQCVVRGLDNVKRFEARTIVREWIELYKSID